MKSIIIKEKTLYYLIVFCLALFNATALSDTPIWIKTIIAAPFLLLVPGSLILASLKIPKADIWEKLVMSVGFSLTFLMCCGFFSNWIFPLLGASQPLSTIPLLCSINIFIMVLMNVLSFRRAIVPVHIAVSMPTGKTRTLFFIPWIFPVLAVMGAISINNNGTNLPTLLMLGGISIYVMVLLIFRHTISSHIYPYALFFLSLSVLLTTSLRGWYITGHDIQLEYHVFQLTKHAYLWNMGLYQDAYNACLSITMLPTILSNFLPIPDAYIYKVIFQIVFAIAPIIVFLFLRKYTTPVMAFLAAFYFLSFPTFLNDMPMLNRQEISFIFFFLLLYVSFNDTIPGKQKKILGIIFGCSMVVSHYATTYIVLGLLTPIYVLQTARRNTYIHRATRALVPGWIIQRLQVFSPTRYISGVMLGVLVVFTFLWNSQLTKTASGLTETITKTFASMHTALKGDNKSADISYSLFFRRTIDDTQYIYDYMRHSLETVQSHGLDDVYPVTTYADYRPEIAPHAKLPLTSIGTILQQWHVDVYQWNYIARQSAAKIIQLLIGIGFIGLFFYKSSRYDSEYVLACLVSMIFIFLMIVLPQLSLNYGLLRLFQQFLVFLGLPVLIGNLLLLRFLPYKAALYVSGSIAVLFFLTISGFISEITGGYYPQLSLNNTGIYYDAFYLHTAEAASSEWLARTMDRKVLVQADPVSTGKLYEMGDIDLSPSIFPQGIQKSGYVYASTTNTKGRTIISVDRSLSIKFPLEFLDTNKNLLYNNGLSKIYK